MMYQVCYDSRMVLFTGKGDDGTTKLFDSPSGVRVLKSAPIFECLGQLDELNTLVGWCKVIATDLQMLGRTGSDVLAEVQNHLFTIQAEVAGAGKFVAHEDVLALSSMITMIEGELPEIKTFLVPGGTEFAARCDMARAVSRRAERRLVALHESGERAISESRRAYANRLSSLFYALGRFANAHARVPEHQPVYDT